MGEKGQTLAEYVILVALVSVAALGVTEVLSSTIRAKLSVITSKLQGRSDPRIELEEVREKHFSKRTMKDFWKTND